MGKFRKKPIEVEATQFTGDPHPHVFEAFERKGHFTNGKQGAVRVNFGDWIIAEQDGSGHYPCADEVFRATYEAVPHG